MILHGCANSNFAKLCLTWWYLHEKHWSSKVHLKGINMDAIFLNNKASVCFHWNLFTAKENWNIGFAEKDIETVDIILSKHVLTIFLEVPHKYHRVICLYLLSLSLSSFVKSMNDIDDSYNKKVKEWAANP